MVGAIFTHVQSLDPNYTELQKIIAIDGTIMSDHTLRIQQMARGIMLIYISETNQFMKYTSTIILYTWVKKLFNRTLCAHKCPMCDRILLLQLK